MPKEQRHLVTIALVTLAALFFLIAVGSTVRATGAGMGCPDWPMCFGQLIPPTDISQLPANYQEIYRDRGYANVEFNALKTWTEFFNRLTGATIGFLSIWTLWAAWRVRREMKPVFWYALSAFLLVGFNAWLGKVVVDSNLHPALITTHMLAALLVVASLVLAISHATRDSLAMSLKGAQATRIWLIIGMILTIIQITLGVQVREHIDVISTGLSHTERATWIAQVGTPLTIHMIAAILVVGYSLWLGIRVIQRADNALSQNLARIMLALVAFQLVFGLGLVFFEFPAFLQPLHLVFAAMIFGVQIALFSAAHHAFNRHAAHQVRLEPAK